jgi:hypothetical protein
MKLKNLLNELFEYKDLENKLGAELESLVPVDTSINMGMYSGDRPDSDPLKGKGYGKITFLEYGDIMGGSFEKVVDWVKSINFEITSENNFYYHEPGEKHNYPFIKFHFNVEDVSPTNP